MVDSVGGGAIQEGQGGAGGAGGGAGGVSGGAGGASGRVGGTVVYDLFCGTGSIGLSLTCIYYFYFIATAYWYTSTCLLVQKCFVAGGRVVYDLFCGTGSYRS